MAITTTERDSIIKVVIGMFNAAPGATYLNLISSIFEANGHNLTGLAKTLAGTTAFQQIHPNFETANEFAVSFLSQFGLSTTQEALDFITSKFNAGVDKATIIVQAISIIDGIPNTASGVAGTAANILDNKAAVATYYSVTKAVPQTDLATLQNVIASVDATAASVTSAQTAIDNGASGVSLALTANQDTLLGGSTNDLFVANVITLQGGGIVDSLQSFDQINGAGGTDTLNATLSGGAVVTPTLTSVENVVLRSTTAGSTIDLGASSGVTTLTASGSTATGGFSTIGAVANLAVTNVAVAAATQTFAGSTATTLNLNVDTDGTIGAAPSAGVGVVFGGNSATTLNITANNANVDLTGAAAAAVTSVAATIAATNKNEVNFVGEAGVITSLTTSGTGSVVVSETPLTALRTLTAGDGGITFSNAGSTAASFTGTTGAGADTLTVTGGNLASLSTGAGNDKVTTATSALAATSTVDLGAGDDTLTLGATPTAGVTLTGGDGTDTLAMATASYTAAAGISGFSAANRGKITGFEVLSITDIMPDTTAIDLSAIAGLGSFKTIGVATGGTATVTGVGANASVTFNQDSGSAADDGALTVTLTDATGSADVLNVTANSKFVQNADATTDTFAQTQTLTAAGVETINFNSTGTRSTAVPAGANTDRVINTLALTDTAITTLTVTGDQSFSYTEPATSTKLATINASANTGAATSTISAAAHAGSAGLTITGSATGASAITGSAKADTIVGGAGADTVTGGLGADTITLGAGNDNLRYANVQDSTVANLDTVTDFKANTFGNGASGAAGTGAGAAASRTGDVITLDLTAMVAGGFTTTSTGFGGAAWSVAGAMADGVVVFTAANASDATTFLANLGSQNNDATVDFAVGAALDSSTGKLYIDVDSNGVADLVIQLTGVTSITAAAFVLA